MPAVRIMRVLAFVSNFCLYAGAADDHHASDFSTLPVAGQSILFAGPMIQLAELTPTTRVNNDWFGISVAVSGDTAVVGAFDSNIEQTGIAYVFVKGSNGWANVTQTATLTPSDAGAGFGTSVAISGDTIVVGAANASNLDNQASGPGAAYVFVKPAGGWTNMTQNAKLTASDGVDGDAFGNSVSISGNTVAVGAFFANNFSGKTYVFVEPSSGWSGNLAQTAELSASDSSGLLDYFGSSVSIGGNTILVGSNGHNNFQGSAYVFVEPASGWTNMTQTAELTASNGKQNDAFGFSSAISGNTAVVGAPSSSLGLGSAYIFVEPASGWVTTSNFNAQLSIPNSIQSGGFAQSVSLSGKAVVVGDAGTTVGTNQNQGAAFLFLEPKSGWQTTSKPTAVLTASDGAANDDLGVSVAVSGNTALAGAPKSNKPGEAYVFGR